MPRKKSAYSIPLFSASGDQNKLDIADRSKEKDFSNTPVSSDSLPNSQTNSQENSQAKTPVTFDVSDKTKDKESYSAPITRSGANKLTQSKKNQHSERRYPQKLKRINATTTQKNKPNTYFKISQKHDNNKKFFKKLKHRLSLGAKSTDELKYHFLELNINPKIMNTFYQQEGKDLIFTSFTFKTTNLLDFLVHIISKPLGKQLLQENNYEILNYFITLQIAAKTYDYYGEDEKQSRINQIKSLICLNSDAVSEFFNGASNTVIPEAVKEEYDAALKLLSLENENIQSMMPSL